MVELARNDLLVLPSPNRTSTYHIALYSITDREAVFFYFEIPLNFILIVIFIAVVLV